MAAAAKARSGADGRSPAGPCRRAYCREEWLGSRLSARCRRPEQKRQVPYLRCCCGRFATKSLTVGEGSLRLRDSLGGGVGENVGSQALRPPRQSRLPLALLARPVLRQYISAVAVGQLGESALVGLVRGQVATAPDIGLKLLCPESGRGLVLEDLRNRWVALQAHSCEPGRLAVSSLALLDGGRGEPPGFMWAVATTVPLASEAVKRDGLPFRATG